MPVLKYVVKRYRLACVVGGENFSMDYISYLSSVSHGGSCVFMFLGIVKCSSCVYNMKLKAYLYLHQAGAIVSIDVIA